MRLLSLTNNERLLVNHIKQKHVLRRSVKMQVALTVNINGRSRTLNSLGEQQLMIGHTVWSKAWTMPWIGIICR